VGPGEGTGDGSGGIRRNRMEKRERPERPPARHRPKPVTTFGPSGLALRATSRGCLGFLPLPLSLGFGAFRASPPVGLVGLPNPRSRCAQSALRLSQGVPFGSLTQPLRLLGARRTLRMGPDVVKVTKVLVARRFPRSEGVAKQCDKTGTQGFGAPIHASRAAWKPSRLTLITTRSTHRPSFHDRSGRRASWANPHRS
jgi:hypothetical protein